MQRVDSDAPAAKRPLVFSKGHFAQVLFRSGLIDSGLKWDDGGIMERSPHPNKPFP